MGTASLIADMGRGWDPGFFLFGFLLPLVIVGLVAYGIWELWRARDVAPAGVTAGGPSGTAMAVLDERFARGEIDAEDYVQRRNLLASPVTQAAGVAPAAPQQPDADPTVTVEQPAAQNAPPEST